MRLILFFFISIISPLLLEAQYGKSSSDIKIGLEKLDVLGSVLYFAAHPDDENTRLITWLANEKKYNTSYLSLTRGDGGQNLIGTELGIELGLIRTQELLAARRIDGGRQFFSSAYDFGFSKTHEETFNFWNKEETLREAVWLIRKLRPDVIINRFPPDKRGGHGHHQASAFLAHEAFLAAADPNRFPEQVKEVGTWQAKRLVWNTANFGGQNNTREDQLKVEIGAYNPLTGASYGEIAALSRSQHKSQGFGAAATRGQSTEYFEHVVGDEAKSTLLDGVNTSWDRVKNSETVSALVKKINKEFDLNHPEKTVKDLIELHKAVQKIGDEYWKGIKLKEIEALILACAGFHIDSYTNQQGFVVNEPFLVHQDIIFRTPDLSVQILEINEKVVGKTIDYNQTFRHQYTTTFSETTQPYWLKKPYTLGKFDVDPADFGRPENRDIPKTTIKLAVNGLQMILDEKIVHRYVDPVRGEIKNPIQITPSLTASTDQSIILLRDKNNAQEVVVEFNRLGNQTKFDVSVDQKGLKISPQQFTLDFGNESSIKKAFVVELGDNDSEKKTIKFKQANLIIPQYQKINYDHIPSLSWFPDLEIKIQPIDLKVSVRKIAYVAGAGDLIPAALRAIGIEVESIEPSQLSKINLDNFDALVVGVRAYNIYPNLVSQTPTLLKYVENGGVVLVQYNVNNAPSGEKIAPYAFNITRSRVTEEDADVKILLPNDPSLRYPNLISEQDFSNWVQERGLYFIEKADKRYRKPLAMHDKDEPSHDGALIITNLGKGKFVYTSLSFFRQLPAGVPGAYRLFVNLLAKEND